MTHWRLAWRNLARNRRRSLLTGSVIAFGFAAMAMAGGFMLQSFSGLKDTAIRSGLGHLQFADARTFSGNEDTTLEYGLAGAASLIAQLAQDPGVAVVMPRVEFFGLVTAGARSIPFMGVGVDPDAERRGSNIPVTVEQGDWLAAGARGAVLGERLATTLKVGVGDTITLLATTADGTLNAVDATVAGIAAVSVKELSERYLAIPLALAQELLVTEDRVSRISVILARDDRVVDSGARLLSALGGDYPEMTVKRWDELAVFYDQVRRLYLGIFGFMGGVLVVVVFLATVNTTLMSVTERTREIGTLRAIGARRRPLVYGFLAEATLLGLVGCFLGTLVALGVSLGLNASGIVMPPPPGFTRGAPIHIEIQPVAYAVAAATLLITLLVASYFPARRAAAAPIVESLTHV